MAIVPDFLKQLLELYRSEIESWISRVLYERIVANNGQHVLVRLQALLDLQPVEAGCQGYYHQTGPGAKPSHGIPRLVRMLLVKYLFNWSLRETETHLNHNLLIRWFVGYEVLESVPDHTTLERFEQWMRAHQQRLFFDTILQQIDQAFPELRAERQVQIGDTYACQANAANEGTIGLLRHTSRLLLDALAKAAPQVHTVVRLALDTEQLFGPADERNYHYLTEAERLQRQATTVRGAWQLRQLVISYLEALPKPINSKLAERVADLGKIMADEFQMSCDEHGQVSQVAEWDAKHKGSYRLISATDREATIRHHGRNSTLGYNVSLAIQPNGVIREIHAATGSEPDPNGVPRLISTQKTHQDLVVTKLIYDQAAGTGRTRAQVEQLNAGQTQLVACIPPAPLTARFTPDDFHFEAEGRLVCPAGRATTSKYHSENRDAWLYSFSAKVCQGCPLWPQCHQEKASPTGARRVFISDYQDQIRRAQAYNQTADFKSDIRLRSRVERVIFMLTNYDGARRARSRGLGAADFQAKMCASVRNLRTWLKLIDQRVLTKPRQVAEMG